MKNTVSEVMVHDIQRWPLERLIPYARNTRTHSESQITEVASSIAEFGFVHPVLAAPDGVIIAGHCRVLAAARLGLREVPVVVLDHLSEVQRQALSIADNQLALNAGWDDEMLRRELATLQQEDFAVEILGFDPQELEGLLIVPDVVAESLEEEAVEKPRRAVSRTGDVWLCGEHRVLCDDPRQWPAVERLMGNESADLVFTNPPVAAYLARRSLTVSTPAERLSDCLKTMCSHYRRVVKPTAALYMCHPPAWQGLFQDALEGAGFAVACQIVWVRQTLASGSGRYRLQHDPLLYAHVAGRKDPWYGDDRQSTLWTPEQPGGHPCRGMPVELVERVVINSSRKGDVLADLFGGCGVSLIACQRLDRRARILHQDCRGVDAMVMRWQQAAGQRAVRESDGKTFREIAAQQTSPKNRNKALVMSGSGADVVCMEGDLEGSES